MNTQKAHEELCEVEISQISLNPAQPRRQFASEELEELADSIRSVGLIHPPLVKLLDKHKGTYELIAGERRLRAAKLAGLKKIYVVVSPQHHLSHSAQAALIENIQRVNLNAMEIAHALRKLIEEGRCTQEELAKRMGKKRSTIANYLRLLSLPLSIQESVFNNKISMGHAKAILSVESNELKQKLHKKIILDELSVRQAERAAEEISKKSAKPNPKQRLQDIHLEQLAGKLQEKLGTKVTIQKKRGGGNILITYYGLDDLDRLIEFFALQQDL